MRPVHIPLCALASLLFLATVGWCAATRPAQTQQATKLTAKVLAIKGQVEVLQGDANTWVPVKVGDVLTAPAEIRTGFRNSAARIQLHRTAVILVRAGTRVALTELSRLPDAEKVRLFLHRGTIRAGILEEKVRSDFQIACPAAVLTREGTWGIEMSYDPATGGYYAGLDTEGLAEVLDQATGRRVGVYAGQYVTQALTRWTQTAAFNRMVSLIDQFGTTKVEKVLYVNNSGGLSGLDPTGSAGVQRVVAPPRAVVSIRRQLTNQRVRRQAAQVVANILNPPDGRPRTVPYRFGNFGTHDPSNVPLITTFRKAQAARKARLRR